MKRRYQHKQSRQLAVRARFALFAAVLLALVAAGSYYGGGWNGPLRYEVAGVAVLAAAALGCYVAIHRIEAAPVEPLPTVSVGLSDRRDDGWVRTGAFEVSDCPVPLSTLWPDDPTPTSRQHDQ